MTPILLAALIALAPCTWQARAADAWRARSIEPGALPQTVIAPGKAASAQAAIAPAALESLRAAAPTDRDEATPGVANSKPSDAFGAAADGSRAPRRLDEDDSDDPDEADAPAKPTATEREREILDEVDSGIGPIVDERETPALYAAIRDVFEPLSQAQQRLFPGGVLSVNRIFIVDSPEKNAFVTRVKEEGIRKSTNLVFITTGLLKALLDQGPARETLRTLMVRVAGILSHELAHPLDHVDGEGIQQNWGETAGMQAMEIRADAEGMAILREAGYPVEGVYQGLKKLFEQAGPRGSTAITEFSQTHPQDDLRLAAQRMLLTLQRYQKGKARPHRPSGLISPSLVRELHSLHKSSRRWGFKKPQTLREAFDRIRKLIDPKGRKERQELDRLSDDYRQIEFNRLLLSIDAFLREKEMNLDDEERKRFYWLMEQIGRGKTDPVFTRGQMREAFTEENASAEFMDYPDHFESMRSIPIYRSVPYVEWARSRLVRGRGVDFFLPALVRVVPLDLVFSALGDDVAAGLRSRIGSGGKAARRRYEDLDASAWGDESYHVEFQLRLAKLFHEKVWPALPPSQRLWFQIGETASIDSYVYPQFQDKKGLVGILTDRMELAGHPGRKDLWDWYQRHLRSIWEARGYHGVLDLIRDDSQMDWESIFAALGIDKNVGYSQLRQAVKQFARSPAFKTLSQALSRLRKPGYVNQQEDVAEWTDATLSPYLSGDLNATLGKKGALPSKTKALFNGNYLRQRPDLFRRLYGRRLAQALDGATGSLSLDSFIHLHENVLKQMIGAPKKKLIPLVFDLQASSIGKSRLPAETKKRLLAALFVDAYRRRRGSPGLPLQQRPSSWTYEPVTRYRGYWLNEERFGANKSVMAALIEQGVIQDSIGFFEQLIEDEDYVEHHRDEGNFKKHFQAVARFKDELIRDLDRRLAKHSSDRRKAAVLRSFAAQVLDPEHGQYDDSPAFNAKDIRDIKAKVASSALALSAPENELFELFYRLTGSGPLKAADAFFRGYFERHYGGSMDARSYKRLSMLLENERIASINLQLAIAQKVLEPEIRRLEARSPHTNELNGLIEKLKGFVPNDSSKKDDVLEGLAWRLRLRDTPLGALIEDEKSYNWRKTSPVLVRLGSAASQELMKLNRKSRQELMEYLISPETREIPNDIVKKIARAIYEDAIRAHPEILRKKNREMAAQKLKEAGMSAADIKLRIEAALMDSTPQERIPFFEILIAGGAHAFVSDPDFPYSIARAFLKHKPGSIEEKLLLAFLNVVPDHEKSVSLAYLLSQVGEDKASVNDLFEVFQAVGVKFAQLNSVWKFLGKEIANENRKLKDQARPLTLAAILRVMNEELTDQERARVKRIKRILGSASLNTVVLIELEDGREVAMAVQRPHAAEQIADNIGLGAKFLDEARRLGILEASRLLDCLLASFRQQLSDELKMALTAKKMREAAGFYAGLNSSLSPVLNGWQFRVPELSPGFGVHDRIVFMEKAEGAPFDSPDLPDAVRSAVGPALVRSSLQTLFRHGWFDPDRHMGNFLIDASHRVIWVMDFGQAEAFTKESPWKADDRATLAQFLAALGRADAARTVRYGLVMSSRQQDAPAGLQAAVAGALAQGGNVGDRLLAVANVFAEHGIAFDKKFAFGAFKGLMVLYGERYVDDAQFMQAMEAEIKRLLTREKLPRALLDRLSSSR